jgi:lipopolysaccharide transport system ATP-binding protein
MPGDDVARLLSVRVISRNGDAVDSADIREPVAVAIEYEVLTAGYRFLCHFQLRNEDGMLLFIAVDLDPEWRERERPPGRYVSTGWIPGNYFAEGLISVTAVVFTSNHEVVHAQVEDAVSFRIVDPLSAKDTSRGDYPRSMPGVVRPMLRWQTRYEPRAESVAADR